MSFRIFKNIIKLAWVNLLWHRHNPYGYCEGWNWDTCQDIKKDGSKVDCPCVKYNVHCGYVWSVQVLEQNDFSKYRQW